ncbi:hypothetical protein HWQ46_01905 [Shewanella sp. D64]|uniref:hypothetical protein n=1 Tax=unclassified Shewanella TaxID=196818 RepID=UPI0022BA1965|nr:MULTISPECIES: hypothetical protein [unclassified Shewanella]MEC4724302.1 hypothetical protein [Shewanella sp. D64]MEC4738814.1 hypothetical protein [Shewanella sp. E94]WBJ97747.1 hypothetical protein HWQ47_11950 [Shewanella sp. MTB7]
MSPEVMHCLKNEMKVIWSHFENKYLSFSPAQQAVICAEIEKMLEASKLIKAGNLLAQKFNDFYFENGDVLLNEFLQSLFDCFKQWQNHDGIELQKSIYAHTNRGTDNWFPVVLIDRKISECKLEGDDITLYRGCDESEFETQEFKKRQSWTSDFSIAKTFAFHHPSSRALIEKRVVVEAVVNRNDILWDRGIESEMVLKEGFSPTSSTVAMTYDDYKAQRTA